MKTIKSLLFLLSFSIMFVACSKDDTAPTITITSPVEGSTLMKGKTYPIEGTVTDDTELASIKVASIDIPSFDSKTSHSIKNITLPISATETATNGQIQVTATDKEGNSTTKTVTFKIQ
jgi:hypothetical protein